METIRKTTNYQLSVGSLGNHIIYQITSPGPEDIGCVYSPLFTKEVANSLCSMDSVQFDYECSELMKVEDFHIEREWANAD